MQGRFTRVFFVLTCLCFFNQALALVERLPVSAFADLPDVRQVHLSPNGEYIASIVQSSIDNKDVSVLTVLDLKTNTSTSLLHADNITSKLGWIRWANDQQILISSNFSDFRQATPSIESRLLVLDIATKKVRNVWPKKLIDGFLNTPQFQNIIVDMLPGDDHHILMELDGILRNSSKLYKVSLKEQKVEPIQRSKQFITRWMTDRQKNIRISTYLNGTSYKILHRFNDDQDWRPLWEFEAFSDEEVWPLGFDQDSNTLYVQALHNNADAIFKVDLRDTKLDKKLVAYKEGYDLNGSLIYSHKSSRVVGIQSNHGQGNTYWDPSYKKLQASINKAMPNTFNTLYSVSKDEMRYVSLSYSDTHAGTYYLIDRKKSTIKTIAYKNSELKPSLMAHKKAISYQARDGLTIEGYLTLPVEHKRGEKYPAVIFPHGGPISYDGKGFDYWTQFLANRGYAVLQMNFRGSSGYGHDFMKSGLQKWGLAMQDDVEDGTSWLIEEGYADAENICILGTSYGGYAALMGLVKTPDLYRCAISFAGVMDQDLLIKNTLKYENNKITKAQVGSDPDALKARSPIYNVNKITKPVLLIHGDQDRRVRVSHSREMQREMEKQGKDSTYIELKNESHYLDVNDNRLATFEAIERFLALHLKSTQMGGITLSE
ncbi:MAG: S9 family peptidase [Bermanella sp.]